MPFSYTLLFFFTNTLVRSSNALARIDAKVETVGWQSDPNGRGTFSLVSNCVLTLTICVYTAMYLSVPPRNESPVQFWLRNIRWALLGIFGPELVLFIAWKQYLSAKSLVRRAQNGFRGRENSRWGGLNENHSDEVTHSVTLWIRCCVLSWAQEAAERLSTHRESRGLWTLVHGFYAGMGGFDFPLRNLTTTSGTSIFEFDCKRLTLTARGVALLADCNLLPDIERQFLNDKSKSDGLSKFLACLQAAWLIVQVIGRLVLGLQITLLEINTLGHVFCVFVIYLLWWHKPRMVLEPITLYGDWTGPLCAYMYMSSKISGQAKANAGIIKDITIKPEISTIAFLPDEPSKHAVNTVEDYMKIASGRLLNDTSNSAAEQNFKLDDGAVRQTSTRSEIAEGAMPQCIPSGSFRPHPKLARSVKGFSNGVSRADYSEESHDLSDQQARRWSLAAEAVCIYPSVKRRFTPINYNDAFGKTKMCLEETEPEELVEEHCSNWFTQGLLPGDYGLVMGMALWFASMAFGGIHAVAWHDYFPSQIESWLWRISAIYITWSGLVWLLINLAARISNPFDEYWNSLRLSRPPFVSSTPLAIICFICGALYTFARMYLVIEAFISIRKLPVSAYQTPDWVQIIPHL
ncbi:MAG: hypothetical protein Q9191_001692 [Dirinaria sp. TL-2023a]